MHPADIGSVTLSFSSCLTKYSVIISVYIIIKSIYLFIYLSGCMVGTLKLMTGDLYQGKILNLYDDRYDDVDGNDNDGNDDYDYNNGDDDYSTNPCMPKILYYFSSNRNMVERNAR